MKRNIAIISAGLLPVPPVKGGAVENLIDELLKENEIQNKYNFTVFGIDDKEAQITTQEYNNSKFIFIPKNSVLDNIYIFITKCFIKAFNKKIAISDIVYAVKVRKYLKYGLYDYLLIENNPYIVGSLSKSRIPILFHIHNDYLNERNGGKKVSDKCKAVITVSNYISQCASSVMKTENIYTLHNRIDANNFLKEYDPEFRDLFRKKYNICKSDIVCVFSGRIQPTKGVKELIEAVLELNRDDIYLIIIGGTWFNSGQKTEYSLECENLAKKASSHIILTGYVDYKKIANYYSCADIGVVPSLWDDPAPLVVLENLVMGLPIICTQKGGIPELINEDVAVCIPAEDSNELRANLKDAISLLADSHDKRIGMGIKSRELGKDETKTKYYSDFVNIMTQIEKSIE